MNFTKICTADLDSPRRELSKNGLEIVIALSFFPEIDFSCVYTAGAIQLYPPQQKCYHTLADINSKYYILTHIPPWAMGLTAPAL